jgi:hypothetical protein
MYDAADKMLRGHATEVALRGMISEPDNCKVHLLISTGPLIQNWSVDCKGRARDSANNPLIDHSLGTPCSSLMAILT